MKQMVSGIFVNVNTCLIEMLSINVSNFMSVGISYWVLFFIKKTHTHKTQTTTTNKNVHICLLLKMKLPTNCILETVYMYACST